MWIVMIGGRKRLKREGAVKKKLPMNRLESPP